VGEGGLKHLAKLQAKIAPCVINAFLANTQVRITNKPRSQMFSLKLLTSASTVSLSGEDMNIGREGIRLGD
jgi:hypothetical protein